MYPSEARTSSTRTRIFEAGVRTVDLPRICALRMRVSISPIGSFISRVSLPARFHHAGQLPGGAQVAQRDPADFQLAVIGVRTPRKLTAVVQARGRAVARQLRELEGGAETLFHRLVLIVDDLFERGTLLGVTIYQLLALFLALDHCFLGHVLILPRLS